MPGRVCAILTADCLPVLLSSRTGDRVGAVHAGWRGLAGGVIEAAVWALDGPPAEMLAWLGPAIGPRHFEVGGEVRDAFLNAAGAGAPWRRPPGLDGPAAADAAAFVPTANGRYLADLYALARCRLARLGVEHVYGGGECTFADARRYFSHRRDARRDGQSGRQATLIWIEATPRR